MVPKWNPAGCHISLSNLKNHYLKFQKSKILLEQVKLLWVMFRLLVFFTGPSPVWVKVVPAVLIPLVLLAAAVAVFMSLVYKRMKKTAGSVCVCVLQTWPAPVGMLRVSV